MKKNLLLFIILFLTKCAIDPAPTDYSFIFKNETCDTIKISYTTVNSDTAVIKIIPPLDSLIYVKSRGHCTKDYYKDSIVSKFFKVIYLNDTTKNFSRVENYKFWKKTINKHKENPCAGGKIEMRLCFKKEKIKE